MTFNKKKVEREGARDAKAFPRSWREVGERKAMVIMRKAEKRKIILMLEGQRLINRAREIAQTLNSGGGTRPQMVLRNDNHKGIFYLFFALLLLVSSYIMNNWSLQPFRLGNEGYIAAAGITVVGTLLMELLLSFFMRILGENAYQKLRAFLIVTSIVAIMTCIGSLGLIRGLLAKVHVSGADLDEVKRFFSEVSPYLVVAFLLFGIGLEMAAALLFHSGWNKIAVSGSSLKLIRELEIINKKMKKAAGELKELETVGKNFLDHYYIGALKVEELQAQKGTSEKWAKDLFKQLIVYVVILIIAIFMAANAFGGVLIAGIDLSGSSKTSDIIGVSELDKNKKALSDLINLITPGTKVFVIGITGESFAKPYFILKDEVSSESGYFGEITKKDKMRLQEKFTENSSELAAKSSKTDILGFIHQAAIVFSSYPKERKILVIFSDMRESADRDFNLEAMSRITPQVFENFKRKRFIPSLEGVSVYIWGCHGSGKSGQYWEDLKAFMRLYFIEAKSELKAYSNIRDIRREVFVNE